MPATVIFEQPLNERIRHFLRLESLFGQIQHFMHGSTLWENQACVSSLIDILTFIERTDIRSEVLKELERTILILSKLSNTPAINNTKLEETLSDLNQQASKIQGMSGRLSHELRDNELINSIRQRVAVSTGTCAFDVPAYHFWLHQPQDFKQATIARWLNDFVALQQGIALLLRVLRDSALFEGQVAQHGFFQKSLDPNHPCQLIRIHLPAFWQIYPEMSGGKHRINIRFLQFAEQGRPKQISDPLEFDMSCCAI